MCGIGVIVILTQLNAFVGLDVKKNIKDVIINLSDTINSANIEALYVSYTFTYHFIFMALFLVRPF